VSVFRFSAWEYREERGQFYLHQFVVGQPDLNYRNPKVMEEMLDVFRFWLDLGVDGFRMDAVSLTFWKSKVKTQNLLIKQLYIYTKIYSLLIKCIIIQHTHVCVYIHGYWYHKIHPPTHPHKHTYIHAHILRVL
jgi:glycosidase